MITFPIVNALIVSEDILQNFGATPKFIHNFIEKCYIHNFFTTNFKW